MKRALQSIALGAGVLSGLPAAASEIRVMSGGAPKEVFTALAPKFEQRTGNKITFVYVLIPELREKVAAGEKADVLAMPVPMLDGFTKDGKVRADARAVFGSVGIVVIVKEGAPKPNISTSDKFREAMLAARSVVHAPPGKTPSGTHMGKVMEQLGIADAIAKKAAHMAALDGGAELVANGQAEIGIYPASEVAEVKGVTIVGSLPPGIDLTLVYGGAAMTGTGEAAADFVKFLAAPENRAAWKHAGFEPPE